MNRSDARRIAETITNQQLVDMLDAAREGITDWTVVSKVNPIMTKGTAWNILGQNFTLKSNIHVLGIKNMIHEFGDWLPEELKQKKEKVKKVLDKPVHQEPIFK